MKSKRYYGQVTVATLDFRQSDVAFEVLKQAAARLLLDSAKTQIPKR